MKQFLLPSLAAWIALACLANAADLRTVRVQGSGIVAKAVNAVAPLLRESGVELKVTAEGGSSAGISAVGEGLAEVGMSLRAVSGQDRAGFPERRIEEVEIGFQAIALVVPRDVWESGVRALSREQMLRVYEGEITNWKQLGGEDRPVKFYNPEQGRGVWELFATWLYTDIRKAPLGERFETVANTDDALNSVEFNAGSLSLLPLGAVDGKGVFALSVREGKGEPIEPTGENVRQHRYPISRPLILLSDRPAGDVRRFLTLMRAPEGQAAVKKNEFVPAVAE